MKVVNAVIRQHGGPIPFEGRPCLIGSNISRIANVLMLRVILLPTLIEIAFYEKAHETPTC
jgi:hypothetical protein